MKKLKQLLKAAMTAKSAWDKAVADKKEDAEIQKLKAAHEKALEEYNKALIAESAADDADDDADGKSVDLTMDEAREMIRETAEKAVADALGKQNNLKKEDMESIVDEAFKKHFGDDVDDDAVVTKDDIKELATIAMKGTLAAHKRASKMLHNDGKGGSKGAGAGDDDDDSRGGRRDDRSQIEIPTTWRKGNLPLHGKQLLNRLLKKDMNEGVSAKDIEKAERFGDALFAKARTYGAKALTSTGVGTGDELVPTDLSSELLRRLYLESTIAQMMLAREIEMPTQPYEMPLITTRPTFFKKSAENTAGAASDPGTARPQLSAVGIFGKVLYSYEVDEDSIIPILPLLQTLLGEAAAAALESALINGDTTGTHMDSDTNAIANAVEKSWKGWRKLALEPAANACSRDISTGGISRANLLALLKKLKKYGKNKRDLMWIVGIAGEADMLGLDDVVTVDKRGPAATTITGSLPSYLGIPIVTSEAAREDLNASGVYDGVTTTKGNIILVNHTRFLTGNRKGFTVETDKDIETQQNKIVASFRKAFTPIETPSATVPSVAIGFNYNA
jgi:HK97 family phage major capsid protein